jgi:toxin ParE1/3/4
MKEINLTPKATEDLEAIWLYSQEQFGLAQADEYVGRFSDIFDVLAVHEIGTERPELGENMFSLPIKKTCHFLYSFRVCYHSDPYS